MAIDLRKIAADLGMRAKDVTESVLETLAGIFGGGSKKRQTAPAQQPGRSQPLGNRGTAPPPIPPRPPTTAPGGSAPSPAPRGGPGFGKLAQEMPGGEPIYTPNSSNVYSFQYDAERQLLYVTFKAQTINGKAIKTGRTTMGGKQSRTQAIGKRGALSGGVKRPNAPGSMYVYFAVPLHALRRLLQKAKSSAGKAVWDELRIRGTMFGHRYQYQLVSGQQMPNGHQYIPRKATAGGFKTRSLRVMGSREFTTSTLPGTANGGFRTRAPRR